MTDATLAKWLREELPLFDKKCEGYPHDPTAIFSNECLACRTHVALTALVALLRETDICMTWANTSKRKRTCQARLDVVLGEGR